MKKDLFYIGACFCAFACPLFLISHHFVRIDQHLKQISSNTEATTVLMHEVVSSLYADRPPADFPEKN